MICATSSAPESSVRELAERQLQDGRSFVLDAPTTVPAVWGDGTDVLWSQGETLIVTGPQGVGKSTLVQQLALARAAVTEPTFLGYPVQADLQRCVLYVAADRPRQIARSFRRMVGEQHADALERRLKVWKGPLPFDLMVEPQRLAMLAEALGAGTIIIDSLKDAAWPLSSDDVGSAVNRALGSAIAADIEVLVVHHNRKATAENKKPKTLADVYGSVWITSGGSVLSLWGEAGDPFVELAHLKQPADDVGPLDLEHDHDLGTTRLRERVDAWSVLADASSEGVTAPDAATAIYGSKPTRSQVEKVRRRLDRFVEKGFATPTPGATRTDPIVFRIKPGVEQRVAPRVGPRELHATPRTPGTIDHGHYTAPPSSAPPLRGGAERVAEWNGYSEDELQELVDADEQVNTAGGR